MISNTVPWASYFRFQTLLSKKDSFSKARNEFANTLGKNKFYNTLQNKTEESHLKAPTQPR